MKVCIVGWKLMTMSMLMIIRLVLYHQNQPIINTDNRNYAGAFLAPLARRVETGWGYSLRALAKGLQFPNHPLLSIY
jgi:hypothetical protein